jgi:hypothetical protein
VDGLTLWDGGLPQFRGSPPFFGLVSGIEFCKALGCAHELNRQENQLLQWAQRGVGIECIRF